MASVNPLISNQESSKSNLQVALHPLVLLSISDYITRHTLRNLPGPMVGALLGQQNGREISIEHAFECLMIKIDGEFSLNQSWFEERHEQMRDVHKEPQLEIIGWYTTMPSTGPQEIHLPIQRQILELYSDSALLLGFHSDAIVKDLPRGKLPLTIYESYFETDDNPSAGGEENEKEKDESQLPLRFKEVSFTIETGEAEMISIDFVARGGGNATATDSPEINFKTNSKGKGSEQDNLNRTTSDSKAEKLGEEERILLREEEELIAYLTTKVNAIKMLQARIDLIASFLKKVHLSKDTIELNDKENSSSHHIILRSIQALLSRLALLVPVDSAAYEQELTSQQNDVNLVSLLSSITESTKEMRDVGMKHGIIENSKMMKKKSSNQRVGPSYKGLLNAGNLLPS
ncbi:COP9 signalosome complex subunit 6 [Golovinomyces cichoracearum]|uniref:COP9 signalosome complex subunit 6 n=1 Tax=Golovinomyces cichoracearum TaxID=62708 RepID=A0A420JAZ6_9PEZI|nr:COP9 signalosome complex subunit 6 [Golovinomyces cichoracearum]